jgi:hypothetical protein
MQITFDAEFIINEKLPGWEALQDDPTLKPKVREALELASAKRAIVENFHYGLTSLNQSIYSSDRCSGERADADSRRGLAASLNGGDRR